MEGIRWVQLSPGERDEFLGTGGTGTLAFASPSGEPPFAIPVSYGYDAEVAAFYFRLSLPTGSGKADRLDDPVTFVAHDRTDEGWRSVVATGRLEEVSGEPYESAAVQGLWAVDIPEVDVFDRPPEEVPFRRFRLDPETLTGRKEVASEA